MSLTTVNDHQSSWMEEKRNKLAYKANNTKTRYLFCLPFAIKKIGIRWNVAAWLHSSLQTVAETKTYEVKPGEMRLQNKSSMLK